MTHTRRLRLAILFTAALLLALRARPSPAEEMYGESLEWLAADSDTIVLGSVAVDPPTSDSLYGDVTLDVSETLRGQPAERLTFNVRLDNASGALADSRRPGVPMLVFLKQGALRQAVVPAGEKVQPIIYNWSFWRGAIAMDGGVLWDAEEIRAAVRAAVEYGASRPSPQPLDIEPPSASAAWQALYGGSGVHVTVPNDARLVALARRWVDGEDPFARGEGERLLKLLEGEGAPPAPAVPLPPVVPLPFRPFPSEVAPDGAVEARLDPTSLVTNGDFEERAAAEAPRYIESFAPGSSDILGWEVADGSIDWIGPTRWTASSRRCCLDVDAPGAIRQTIATVPGQVYLLAFDMAGNVEQPPAMKRLAVQLAGAKHEFEFDATGHSSQDLGWVRRRIVFRAAAETTTLTFASASTTPTASGIALDNVTLHVVDVAALHPQATEATSAAAPTAEGEVTFRERAIEVFRDAWEREVLPSLAGERKALVAALEAAQTDAASYEAEEVSARQEYDTYVGNFPEKLRLDCTVFGTLESLREDRRCWRVLRYGGSRESSAPLCGYIDRATGQLRYVLVLPEG